MFSMEGVEATPTCPESDSEAVATKQREMTDCRMPDAIPRAGYIRAAAQRQRTYELLPKGRHSFTFETPSLHGTTYYSHPGCHPMNCSSPFFMSLRVVSRTGHTPTQSACASREAT